MWLRGVMRRHHGVVEARRRLPRKATPTPASAEALGLGDGLEARPELRPRPRLPRPLSGAAGPGRPGVTWYLAGDIDIAEAMAHRRERHTARAAQGVAGNNAGAGAGATCGAVAARGGPALSQGSASSSARVMRRAGSFQCSR
jgi:hypothetical protein